MGERHRTPLEELVEDAIAGHLDELARVRHTLDTRYDDIKSGKVKLIPGAVAYAQLMDSINARRSLVTAAGSVRRPMPNEERA